MKVKSGEGEIFWQTLGAGPDVVLVHPFPSCHEFWLPVAERLADSYRVTLFDLRGHGKSTSAGSATMAQHAADLERVCREAGIGTAAFAGVSIGGYVLFEFWRAQRQRVRSLVLADTRPGADSAEGRANRLNSAEDVRQRGVTPFLDTMLPKLLGESTQRNRPDIVAAARATLRHSTPAGVAAVQLGMAERPDSVATLTTINVQTLIMVGDEDGLTPVAEAQLMHSQITGSQLHILSQAGHFAIFEKPEESLGLLRKFLDGLK